MGKVGLFDLDGTLCDHDEALVRDMGKIASPFEPPFDPTAVDPFGDFNPWIQARLDMVRMQPGWWSGLSVMKAGFDVFSVAKGLGFEIQILTKGPRTKRMAWMEKCEWVDQHLGADIPVNIVGKDKSAYYGSFLCDDYGPYMLGWLEHRPRGLGILINAKTNKDIRHPNLIRYDGAANYAVDILNVIRHLKAVAARGIGEHWRDHLEKA